MAKYLDETGLAQVWSKTKSATGDHTSECTFAYSAQTITITFPAGYKDLRSIVVSGVLFDSGGTQIVCGFIVRFTPEGSGDYVTYNHNNIDKLNSVSQAQVNNYDTSYGTFDDSITLNFNFGTAAELQDFELKVQYDTAEWGEYLSI